MHLQNASITVTEFTIVGFDKTKRPMVVGVVILITYVLTILANMTNILFIIYDKRLHKPMYLLICNLAAVDILHTSSVSPTMIGILVAGVNTISYVPCFIQMLAFHLGGVMEMFSLSIMAFDRLVAISCPFRYHTVSPLPHCYSTVKYTFCDYAAIVRTTCVDPNYYFNLATKMGSTCLTHLIVVTCYYSQLFIAVVFTRLGVVLTLEARHGLMIGSALGPSLVNPFVYCLRTKEIKSKIFRVFKKVVTSQ
ncbi:olfactory receptor 4D11-like [Xiphias gladius]|uniref:olfactory receptor 4D11-like n=1 Tax=Xiphias gladius TaxID=8245 RepID=UPI001A98AED1|nr:olfactory receptor 4D11-like [Xiphias gladius]